MLFLILQVEEAVYFTSRGNMACEWLSQALEPHLSGSLPSLSSEPLAVLSVMLSSKEAGSCVHWAHGPAGLCSPSGLCFLASEPQCRGSRAAGHLLPCLKRLRFRQGGHWTMSSLLSSELWITFSWDRSPVTLTICLTLRQVPLRDLAFCGPCGYWGTLRQASSPCCSCCMAFSV